MEARDGEKSRQAGAQIAEWLTAAWNRLAYDALAGVCFCSGRARPCSGAASVASEMTSFTSQWRMRAHPARGVQSCRGRQCPRDDRRPCSFPSCILCLCRYKRARTSTHQRRYVTTMGTDNASVECACTPIPNFFLP